MSQAVVLSRVHRDALYSELLNDLTTLRDLALLLKDEENLDVEACGRTARKLIDALRLIEDGGLGWGYPDADDTVVLSLPAQELRQLMVEQRRSLARAEQIRRHEREQVEAEWSQLDLAQAACTSVIEQIGGVR